MKVEVIAIHEIQAVDEDTKKVVVHAPGSKFKIDSEEGDRLLALGAVQLAPKAKAKAAEQETELTGGNDDAAAQEAAAKAAADKAAAEADKAAKKAAKAGAKKGKDLIG